MGEFWLAICSFFGFAWWVEIKTAAPPCTYYFGPFGDRDSAAAESAGYVEDLESEGARGIVPAIKRCRPPALTLVADEFERERLETLGTAFRER